MKRQSIARIIIIVVPVLAYELLTRFQLVDTFTFIPFTQIVKKAFQLAVDPSFLADHALATLSEIVISFVGSSLLGIVIGVILWRSDLLFNSLQPYLLLVYALPLFALYPVFIMLFGLGPLSIVIMAMLWSIASVIGNTAQGFRETKKVLIKVGHSLNLSSRQMLFHIFIPAAWPQIFTGLKLAGAYSIIGVIASEFILSTKGLGYTVSRSYNNFETEKMYGVILLIVVFSLAVTFILNYLESIIYKKEIKGK